MAGVKIRLKRLDDVTLVRLLIAHPMETGRRIDPESGEPIAAHYINRLTVAHGKQVIASCDLGPGISQDPYFSFRFKGGAPGDLVTVTWSDNRGGSERVSATIR